jgi:tetratricopeptide (TPR) repeat protein
MITDRRPMFAALVAIVLLATPAFAQDEPAPAGEEAAPAVEAADEETEERRLRLALYEAGDAWQPAATALAAWLEPRGRFMEAAGLRRRLRIDAPSAETCAAEAAAVLGFAEQVLAAGGGGGGIRAAFEDAKLALERARDAGADTLDTALGLARCAAAQGDAEREITELAGAAERWPDDPRARRALGFAYQNAGRFDEAVTILRELAEDAPDELILWRALSYSARMAGDEEAAVAAANRAIDCAPDASEAWQSLWAVYAPAKRYGELADAMIAKSEQHPESAAAAHYTGFALSSARRPDQALLWLERAWEATEANHEARLQAARILITDKQDEEGAAALYAEVLELSPGHRGALDGMSFLAVKLGNEQRHAEALPYFRAVAEGYADDGRSWANLGLALRWAGRYEEAVTAYEKAVETSPGDAQLRNDFGLLLLVMKRDEDAARVFEETHEVDPLANDCLENLGFMARERGDLEAARKWFTLAWEAAIRRGNADLIQRHRRNVDDVRFPLPPLR